MTAKTSLKLKYFNYQNVNYKHILGLLFLMSIAYRFYQNLIIQNNIAPVKVKDNLYYVFL